MRRIDQSQSALRAPLNRIFGTEANVRLLRALVHARSPLSRGELARRARLTPQGAAKAVDRLLEMGIVERVGAGPTQQVELREEHPLAPAVRALYAAEEERFGGLLQALREVVENLRVLPGAVWVEGPVADGADDLGEPLLLKVLAGSRDLEAIAEAIRDRLVAVERRFDVTIEVQGFTRAEMEIRAPSTLLLVWGPSPWVPTKSRVRDHTDLDRRSREHGRRIADLLLAEPSLVPRAREHVEDRLSRTTGGERKELLEWRRILQSMSPVRLRNFLAADGERATRLRQSSPFWAVLTDAERETVLSEEREASETV
ncbi:MAG TPA: winged helix-turn-helix domain-containing protein [Longimicrobiaceae bacterium]|nr:winged helix-turn-helix domain-containing protein [Longimicrobiaceae bacterium]